MASRPLLLATAFTLASAATSFAQFNPYGGFTITTGTNTAQTLSGAGTISSTGSISVSTSSVSLGISGSGSSLDNSGLIENTSTGRSLVADGTGIVITNEASGIIRSYGQDAVRSSSSTTTITFTNYGMITAINTATANPQQAVDWNSVSGSNTFNNYGTVSSTGDDAIRPGIGGVVNNYANGVITSANNTAGTKSDGIDAQTNSNVQVTNSGMITGGRHGITGGNTTTGVYAMSITNNMSATIQGSNGAGVNIDGINGQETVTIVNRGTIIGNGSALLSGESSHDGDGVDVDGLVNLTNYGTIRSDNAINDTSEGVTVGGGTIVNYGTILGNVASGNTSGATGRGITIAGVDKDAAGNPIAVQAPYAATTITNSGTIRGTSDSAIAYTSAVTSNFTHTINNLAGGTLEGGGAVAAVRLGPDNDIVNNSGSVVADTSGIAIDLGAGNNALMITGGSASITGAVSGGTGGTNTLVITPGAGGTFSFSAPLSNFNSVAIGSSQLGADGATTYTGGRAVLSGANTYTGTTTVYNGATLVANTPMATGSATGSGTVSVQSGGNLAGNGFVAGPLTLAAGAAVSPGDGGVGTLTIGSGLTAVDGTVFNFDLGNLQLPSDRLTLQGTLNFSGGGHMTFNISGSNIAVGSYDLIDFTSSSGLTAANLQLGTVPAGFAGNFTVNTSGLVLNVTTVPESMTLTWVGVAMAGGLITNACRRRSSR